MIHTAYAYSPQTESALNLQIRGMVQGVGFRPFIYQLAKIHHLAGWVCNCSGEVWVVVEGRSEALADFLADISRQAPPLAKIYDITSRYGKSSGYTHFEIRNSLMESKGTSQVPPDVGICSRCLAEITDPRNRRYGYPFTNCTDCGPRFTIIRNLPYDRNHTSMDAFGMCGKCRKEYENPLSRRFHAQPNGCPDCGPRLNAVLPDGTKISKNPILAASEQIKRGKIVALKGLGGFLLACDATNPQPLARLRHKKDRPSKPFAIMMQNVSEIENHCAVSLEEADVLNSPASPIVLLNRKSHSDICPQVAPDLDRLGVMLPYTPLHHILMNLVDRPLVMTSGNVNELPIIKDNTDALAQLAGIADLFLLHNRDILACCDDSVVALESRTPRVIRRARGYVPEPFFLSSNAPDTLAFGADLKNTFCLTRNNQAILSPHLGDLKNRETLLRVEDMVSHYQTLFQAKPEIVACDSHPDYFSTGLARTYRQQNADTTLVTVQHHHAHIVSCMAENHTVLPVLGIAFDGTGFGSDGCIWGGEFMLADEYRFTRLGHLEYIPLPGGETAVLYPGRMAVSYLLTLLGKTSLRRAPALQKILSQPESDLLLTQITKRINSPLTSSAGRLCDAVSALLGIRNTVDYEAQAAIELEASAKPYFDKTCPYDFEMQTIDDLKIIRLKKMFQKILTDLAAGISPGAIAASFHHTLVAMIVKMSLWARQFTGVNRIALSGGVFQNQLLSRQATAELKAMGFRVYRHSAIPCNDGGVSLGQAVVAHHSIQRRR